MVELSRIATDTAFDKQVNLNLNILFGKKICEFEYFIKFKLDHGK